MSSLAIDLAGAASGANVASLGARSPCVPALYEAIDRAAKRVASKLLLEGRTAITAELGLNENTPGALFQAVTAGLRACVPDAPRAHLTVDWARLVVARLRVLKFGAWVATKLAVHDDTARTDLLATAALGIAVAEAAPARHLAMYSTGFSAALLVLLEVRALVAIEFGIDENLARPRGQATTAVGGALGPRAEGAHDTMDGARARVAQGLLAQVGAPAAVGAGLLRD